MITKDELFALLRRGEAPPTDAGLFGAEIAIADAGLVFLPVPWEPTTSYGKGTAKTPKAIIPASHQLDLFDEQYGLPFEIGIAMDHGLADKIAGWNEQALVQAERATEHGDQAAVGRVNELSAMVNREVEAAAEKHRRAGKLVAVLGGDHSSPLGLIRALGKEHNDFGILHVDAHFDLRAGYQGFQYSHAAIMYNVLAEVPSCRTLVQVGLRDFSQDEYNLATNDPRCRAYTDRTIQERKLRGESFHQIAADIVARLPSAVYLSIDIDGLDPTHCPSTGTPVPGGLTLAEFNHLIDQVVRSGRQIIGFDLCEVAPHPDGDEWDLNVGARVLYRLCATLKQSQKSRN